MDIQPATEPSDPLVTVPLERAMSRRGLLRAGALTGGGLVAATIAACSSPAARSGWIYATAASPAASQGAAASAAPATASPSAAASDPASHVPAPTPSAGPSASATPADHDAVMKAVVDRFLGGEATEIQGYGNQPLEPRTEDGVKIFELTVEEMDHRIDAHKDPVKALGFNGTWPGPRLTVTEGDRVRATFTNKMHESTGIHFHGQRLPNAMDGVPNITQAPIEPGASFTYEFEARTTGSHMYHSHHNATDQVGRGLLGAFIVQPKDPEQRYDRLYGATQDIVWISNDALGGFTINGRGFPATAPIVAKLGETIVIRFMNEGNMMHPWHLHGMPMRVVARDGYALGPAAFTCDTLGVNPGERWDVVITCDEPGAWAFHCHILQHAEGQDGMFGMVTALIVQDASASTGTVDLAAVAATPFICAIPNPI